METIETEYTDSERMEQERPSKEFLLAVSRLLETNTNDLLTELGYVAKETAIDQPGYAMVQ